MRLEDNSHVSCFSFVTWNVDGQLSKLDSPEFVCYVVSFDFINLRETVVKTFQSSLLISRANNILLPCFQTFHTGEKIGWCCVDSD